MRFGKKVCDVATHRMSLRDMREILALQMRGAVSDCRVQEAGAAQRANEPDEFGHLDVRKMVVAGCKGTMGEWAVIEVMRVLNGLRMNYGSTKSPRRQARYLLLKGGRGSRVAHHDLW